MTRFRRAEGWFDTQVKDEVLMMHEQSGKFVSLNASAAVIWAALEQPRTSEDLVSVLLETFEVEEETVRGDVVDYLADLEQQGALIAEER